MGNVVIIGMGPAGISAALYTARAGIETTVIGKNFGAIEKVDRIENYYGFELPIGGKELALHGIAQAKRLGVKIIDGEVVGIGYTDKFTVKTTTNEFSADAVILATGASRHAPNIKGLREFEGKGVSYCATCDAFFYKGKDVAVLGCCEYALSEAMELLPIVKSVTMITDGHTPTVKVPKEIKVIKTKIKEFTGSDTLEKIVFEKGSLAVAGVFIAIDVAGSAELAKKMGAKIDGNVIAVDEKMATNIPGLFAAGDCTGGMLQIAKAVYQGATAGLSAAAFLRG